MTTAETLMEDLADRGENPAEAPYNCVIEIDPEEHNAVVVWVEGLQFHAEYNGPREYPAHAGYGAWTSPDNWTSRVNSDGWLTGESERHLANRLNELLRDQGGAVVDVDTVEYGGDEPNVAFEVVTKYREGETYQQWLDRVGWPVVATLINVTDPGTFNSAYLFDLH